MILKYVIKYETKLQTTPIIRYRGDVISGVNTTMDRIMDAMSNINSIFLKGKFVNAFATRNPTGI